MLPPKPAVRMTCPPRQACKSLRSACSHRKSRSGPCVECDDGSDLLLYPFGSVDVIESLFAVKRVGSTTSLNPSQQADIRLNPPNSRAYHLRDGSTCRKLGGIGPFLA